MNAVNLHKAFSAVQESLAELFDALGVPRSFTTPYIDQQSTSDHMQAVGKSAQQSGGLTNNLVVTAHHSSGRGWGTGDGSTIGFPAFKLKETVIPKDFGPAISAIAAEQRLLNDLANLLGRNDKTIRTAQSQLDLVKKTNAAGMTAYDIGIFMQQIPSAALQAVARSHNATKSNPHHPRLTPPRS